MATVRLTGILQNGSQPVIPSFQEPNPRQQLRVTQGGSLTIELTVVDPAGAKVVLTGTTLTLTVRTTLGDGFTVLVVTGTAENQIGRATFQFTPVQTRPLAGNYIYDVWRETVGGERDAVIPTSPLLVEPSVGLPA